MTSAITDFSQYGRMRLDANTDDPAVLREVAGQFEALFVQTLLKNMRDSSLGEPVFGQSNQHDMYQGMLDQQFAVEMSKGRGIGIADMLIRQLGGEVADLPVPPPTVESFAAVPRRSPPPRPAPSGQVGTVGPAAPPVTWNSPAEFTSDLWPHAVRAGEKLDIAPQALLAQAALETGWGAHVMQRPDGGSSFNFFGIKAGSGWQGTSVAKTTLEFRDGIARRESAKFRAYPDIAATFDDFASFIGDKSRYSSVLGAGQDVRRFGSALQEAGYATDPHYAAKIERIFNGETMREALQSLKSIERAPINLSVSPVSGR